MNPQRAIDIVGALLVAAVFGLMGLNAVQNPVDKERAWLATELKKPASLNDEAANAERDFAAWQKAIAENPDVWSALSAPPPPPPPPSPPPCNPPSVDELKKQLGELGLRFTRAQIGQKVKAIVGGNKRGEFFEVGDTVAKSYTLKAFDRSSVTLTTSFTCPDKKEVREIELTLRRE